MRRHPPRAADARVRTVPVGRRRLARSAAALVLAGAAVAGGTGSAGAAEYRYWSFWEGGGHGSWSYATEGPATLRPADGDVIGFRFAVSTDSAHAARPRAAADFHAACHTTAPRAGRKRVAVVLDFGTAADAPGGDHPPARRGACARVPGDANAGDALQAVAGSLRYGSSALLCAVSGYPRSGCADEVATGSGARTGASPADSSSPHAGSAQGSPGGGPSAGLLGGVAAVVVLGAAGFWQARRRRG